MGIKLGEYHINIYRRPLSTNLIQYEFCFSDSTWEPLANILDDCLLESFRKGIKETEIPQDRTYHQKGFLVCDPVIYNGKHYLIKNLVKSNNSAVLCRLRLLSGNEYEVISVDENQLETTS